MAIANYKWIEMDFSLWFSLDLNGCVPRVCVSSTESYVALAVCKKTMQYSVCASDFAKLNIWSIRLAIIEHTSSLCVQLNPFIAFGNSAFNRMQLIVDVSVQCALHSEHWIEYLMELFAYQHSARGPTQLWAQLFRLFQYDIHLWVFSLIVLDSISKIFKTTNHTHSNHNNCDPSMVRPPSLYVKPYWIILIGRAWNFNWKT